MLQAAARAVLVALAAAVTARAAVPYPSTVQTATSYGDTAGSGQSNFRSIAVDAVTGVTYSAGWCKGTLPIGTLPPLVCLGNSDMLLVKTGPDGTPLKAVNFGSAGGGSYPDGEQVYSMVLSADGKYLFAAGAQVATTTYPTSPTPTTITQVRINSQTQPIYMKLDAATLEPIWVNTILWPTMVNQPGGILNIEGVAIDSNGDVVISGYFSTTGTVDFGNGVTMNQIASTVMGFVAKANGAGQVQWAIPFGNDNTGYGVTCLGVDTDVANNIYVIGDFEGIMTVGTLPPVTADGNDGYVIKFGPNGTPTWTTTVTGQGYQALARIAVQMDGTFYAVGTNFGSGSAVFGSKTVQNSQGIIVFAKYDADGSAVWANGTGPTDRVNAYILNYAITIAPESNQLYIGGAWCCAPFIFNGQSFTADYDGFVFTASMDTGALGWMLPFPSSNGYSEIYGMAIGPNSQPYATGLFITSVMAGDYLLTTRNGATAAMIVKFYGEPIARTLSVSSIRVQRRKSKLTHRTLLAQGGLGGHQKNKTKPALGSTTPQDAWSFKATANTTAMPGLPVAIDQYGVVVALTNAAGASLDQVSFSAAECAIGAKGSRERLQCASSAGKLLFTEGTPGVQKKYGANGRWAVTGRFIARNTSQAATITPLGLSMWTPVTPVIAFSGANSTSIKSKAPKCTTTAKGTRIVCKYY